MRKIIAAMAITLDGYIEGPNGEYDWCFTDQDYGLTAFFNEVDAIFIGRKSYQMMLQYANDHGGEWVPGMPEMSKYVFSNTFQSVHEDAMLVSGDSILETKKIKEQQGKDIWLFGGASLFNSLLEEGLVDELWLSVHPILLGVGKRLFADQNQRANLTLLQSKTYETGLVSLRYSISNS